MKKKVLIIYAPYGSGHKSIAEYIEKYFKERNQYEIKVLDVAKYAKVLGKVSIKAFDYVINHRKNLTFSLIYDITNNKLGTINQMDVVKKAFDNKNLREEIIGFNPDLTISTHFFGSNVISYYNKLGLINSKIMTVVTDYVAHQFWQKNHEDQDAFIVANEVVKRSMIKSGIKENKIYPFGLPFKKENKQNLEAKEEIFYKFNFDLKRKTYLFFGGGSAGAIANYEYFKALVKKNYNINLIFISGRNQKLEEKCRSYVVKNNIKNVKVLGFVKDIMSLINASDVCITKPGGATITECIDMKLPMILIPGNGGPEKYNARFVCKKHYGMKVRNQYKLCKAIKKLINNEHLLRFWQFNLNKERENKSITKIYNLSEKLLK